MFKPRSLLKFQQSSIRPFRPRSEPLSQTYLTQYPNPSQPPDDRRPLSAKIADPRLRPSELAAIEMQIDRMLWKHAEHTKEAGGRL
jgi:hypothetical protein